MPHRESERKLETDRRVEVGKIDAALQDLSRRMEQMQAVADGLIHHTERVLGLK